VRTETLLAAQPVDGSLRLSAFRSFRLSVSGCAMSQSPLLLQEYAAAVIHDRLAEAAHARLCQLAQAARPPRRALLAALLRAAADRLEPEREPEPEPKPAPAPARDRLVLIAPGAE